MGDAEASANDGDLSHSYIVYLYPLFVIFFFPVVLFLSFVFDRKTKEG